MQLLMLTMQDLFQTLLMPISMLVLLRRPCHAPAHPALLCSACVEQTARAGHSIRTRWWSMAHCCCCHCCHPELIPLLLLLVPRLCCCCC